MSSFRRRLMMAAALQQGGELPQWFIDSIVCWYDVKKQKLSNNDIILGKPFILKDFSHNHSDMIMRNFNPKENGMGLFGVLNFNLWTNYGSDRQDIEKLDNKFVIKSQNIDGRGVYGYLSHDNKETFRIKVTGLPKGIKLIYGVDNIWSTDKDGIYDISYESKNTAYGFRLSKIIKNVNIEIQQLRIHTDALCFDGQRTFGINDNLPRLDDYEMIINRYWLGEQQNRTLLNISNGDNIVNVTEASYLGSKYYNSFGIDTPVEFAYNGIIYVNTLSYNGRIVVKGTNVSDDINTMYLGARRDLTRFGCFGLYQLLLFKKTLLDSQRKWVIGNLISQ